MNSKDLYEKICLVKVLPYAVFQLYLERTVRELTVRYGKKYTYTQAEIPLMEAYEDALYAGILYRITDCGEYGSEYERLSQNAYGRVWRDLAAKEIEKERGEWECTNGK